MSDRLAAIKLRCEDQNCAWPVSGPEGRYLFARITTLTQIVQYFVDNCACVCGDHDAMLDAARQMLEEADDE